MPTDTKQGSITEFYPLTRQQLEVPAVPMLRLESSPLGRADSGPGRPTPHFAAMQAAARPYTVADRLSQESTPLSQNHVRARELQSVADRLSQESTLLAESSGTDFPSQFPSPLELEGFEQAISNRTAGSAPTQLPEVRFHVQRSQLPTEFEQPKQFATAADPGALQIADDVTSETYQHRPAPVRTVDILGDLYPFWLSALVQIFIGTLIVILLVKFASLVRESFGVKPTSAALVLEMNETTHDNNRVDGIR